MHKLQLKTVSQIGDLYLVASQKGLCGIFWEKQNIPMLNGENDSDAAKYLHQSVKQLEEYFAEKRKQFELPFDVQGTDFQKRVWQALSDIPYGETRSYQQIAVAINNKKACRAVGSANGKNPLAIMVPCHRVIAANGGIGGYAGGLTIKTQLLDLEKNSAFSS